MKKMKPRVQVVAAVLHRWRDDVFELALFQRKSTDSGAGLWEFPGGKIEPGESPVQALVREIEEELSLRVQVLELLGTETKELGSRVLDLRAYWVETSRFDWTLVDHDGARWVNEHDWSQVQVAPLDLALIEKAFREKRPRP